MKKRFAVLLAGLVVSQIALSSHLAPTTPSTPASYQPASYSWSEPARGLYDPEPKHLWNRLYRQFHVRVASDGKEYGYDVLDPLLWPGTKYLLIGPSHAQALSLLDEFLATHAEKLISDPLKRAIFQRDLWAIFDWLSQGNIHQREREELQTRLARVIQRLALTAEQIKLLPDNYSAAVQGKSFAAQYQPESTDKPFLPPELFLTSGPWVAIGPKDRAAATSHLTDFAFAGRSVFLVFMHLPEGHGATIAYLQKLKEFPQPLILNPDRSRPNQVLPNPELPQFPAGTELALVRRMVLIDNQGKLTPTQITESVQIRAYRTVPSGTRRNTEEARTSQKGFEFRLSRRKLFAGEAGGLRPVLSGEKDFEIFRSHGIDWFEGSSRESLERFQFSVLEQCAVCHIAPGIHSVLSYSVQRFQPASLQPIPLTETQIANEEDSTTSWKRRQYEWGLLKGLWQARP